MAKARFTDAFVRNARPGDYWDTVLPGLGLRVFSTGKKTWVVLAPNRRKIGTYPTWSLAEARRRARRFLQKIEAGNSPFETEVLTFGDVAVEYFAKYAERNHSQSWLAFQKAVLKKDLLPALGDRRLASIQRRELVNLVDEIGGRGLVIANRTRAILMAMFNWAADRELLDQNPASRLPKAGREKPRERVLTRPELHELFAVCAETQSNVGSLLLLRFLTLQRESSIRQMEWEQLEGDRWTIPRQKNQESLLVFLSRQALQLIEPRRGLSDKWVFPSRPGGSHAGKNSQGLSRLKKRISIPPWQPRDLRRTGATILAEAGVDPFLVDLILGHRDRRSQVAPIYDRYTYSDEKQAAMCLLGDIYEEVVSLHA